MIWQLDVQSFLMLGLACKSAAVRSPASSVHRQPTRRWSRDWATMSMRNQLASVRSFPSVCFSSVLQLIASQWHQSYPGPNEPLPA
jgi:hypothetical protein